MTTDIDVRLNADAGPLRRGLRDGERSVRDFSRRSAEMGRNVARAGTVIVASMAAITGAVLAAANEASQMALEIRNLSRVAGIGTTEFQRYAAASRTVGIEQDKLADILKDVNDKFGDYMATGAGPLADFFENIAPAIGVTADQFARLSGPEALQLYVSSLEKAGVSQQQMTFYMEALASDATMLIPLLQNGGRELKRFGDAAQDAGRVIDEDGIDALVEMEQELSDMTRTIKTQATQAIIDHKDQILALAGFITDKALPALIELGSWFFNLAEDAADATKKVGEFLDVFDAVLSQDGTRLNVQSEDPTGLGLGGMASDPNAPAPSAEALSALYGTGTVPPELLAPPSEPLRLTVTPETLGTPGTPETPGGGGGNGRSGPTREDLEALQENLASEQELIQLNYENQLADLEEFRAAKLGSEEEYNDIEAKIRAEHLESMQALEKAAQRARLRDIGGAFGDLSSLMQAENKKLFKIGQAAALAEATVNGYSAAVASFEKGAQIGGPVVGALFAAASLAKTGALINQIASASPSGGGSASAGGGGSSAAPAGGGGDQQPATTFAFTIQNDPMGFGESFARQMIEQLNASQRNGGRIQGVIA